MKNDMLCLIKSHSFYELVKKYSVKEISQSLSFRDGLRLSYKLLYNEKWDADLQDWSINLLKEIRSMYPDDWKDSWKYDAWLGTACYVGYKHEERYEAYKKAFDMAKDPPPKLLIEMARCSVCPGLPPISYDQAIDLIMRGLKEASYTDGIGLLCIIYSL
ncbi:MAG TPA: hypothetical protein VGP47_00510, partial [Parachlamydiaceae bacterium]|nr:hypothetical protein [Nitrosopumilus sp.]HEV8050946.1 hypothetical protein [Parachlamydiaceae bacterium]